MRSMGSHQSAAMKSDTWITPREIVDALGPFDLDPCAAPVMPWRTAETMYQPPQDGLALPWAGFVWLNPPYGREAVRWLRRLAEHGHGIALTFARTETRWFWETIWPRATSLFFFEGRITFCNTEGVPARANSGAPNVLVAYGDEANDRLTMCSLRGAHVRCP